MFTDVNNNTREKRAWRTEIAPLKPMIRGLKKWTNLYMAKHLTETHVLYIIIYLPPSDIGQHISEVNAPNTNTNLQLK